MKASLLRLSRSFAVVEMDTFVNFFKGEIKKNEVERIVGRAGQEAWDALGSSREQRTAPQLPTGLGLPSPARAQPQRLNVPSISSSLPQPVFSSWTSLEKEKALAWKAHRIEGGLPMGCRGELPSPGPLAAHLSTAWQVTESLTKPGCLIRRQPCGKSSPKPFFPP